MQYGADGSLYDWWDDETAANYKNKTSCFVRGYSNYTAENDSISVTDLLIHLADVDGPLDPFRNLAQLCQSRSKF